LKKNKVSYSYEEMSKLRPSWTKTEQAKHLGISRPTLDNWLIKFEKEKECKEKLYTFNKLKEAIQSEFGLSPEMFIKQVTSDMYVCTIKRL